MGRTPEEGPSGSEGVGRKLAGIIGSDTGLESLARDAMYICTVRAIVSRASPKNSCIRPATSSRRMKRPDRLTKSARALFISSAVS